MDGEDYATAERLAIYLEIGWSDCLLAHTAFPKPPGRHHPDPLTDTVRPDFFAEIGDIARGWADEEGVSVDRYCDVGGATGRMIHEIDRRFPDAGRLVLVEPSKTFCDWAKLLLTETGPLPDIPVIDRVDGPKFVRARSRPLPIVGPYNRFELFNGGIEDYEAISGFDLVTCLNVVDRHPEPATLVRALEKLMNPGGILIMSSPFDFSPQATPNRDVWIDDLNLLFDESGPWRHIGERNVFYEYRSFNRCWIRFSAQVVAKCWTGA